MNREREREREREIEGEREGEREREHKSHHKVVCDLCESKITATKGFSESVRVTWCQ